MPKGQTSSPRFLADQGVETVFELVGGMITHLLDSIHQDGRIRIVSMHHEQGAAFAAEGFGADDGRPRRRDGDERPRRDQPADRHRQLLLRLDARGLHHRPGQPRRAEGRPGDPPARVPGDRHRRDGRADHQGGLAGRRRPSELPAMLDGPSRSRSRAGPGRSCSTSRWTSSDADVPAPPWHGSSRAGPATWTRHAVDELIGALAAAERPLILAGGGVRVGRGRPNRSGELVDALRRAGRPLAAWAVDVLPSATRCASG